MTLSGIMNTGRTGLFAQQNGLSITSNNIANVNTPGYTRQRATLESLATGGVTVNGTQRLRDGFVAGNLRDSNARLSGKSTLSLNLSQIELTLSESEDSGVSVSIRKFYESLQQLSINPGGTTERDSVLSQSRQMITTFQSVSTQLTQIRRQLDQQIVSEVNHFNELTSQIAELNSRLLAAGSGQTSEVSQMLDRRDLLLDELSTLGPIRVLEGDNGVSTVFVGEQVVVEGNTARKLLLRTDPANANLTQVMIEDIGGQLVSMKPYLHQGKLGALIESRDAHAVEAIKALDRLSAQMIADFNQQHRLGTGLDGVSGRDFFSGLDVSARPTLGTSTGVQVTSTSVLDDSLLTFHDYEIRFTSSAQYDVVNTTTGATVSAGNAYVSGADIDFEGMRVVLTNGSGPPAAGDVFAVDSYTGSTQRMDLAVGIAGNTDAIGAGLTSAPGDNENVLALMGLRDQASMGNPPTQTYEEFYNGMRLKQSMAAATAQTAEQDELITNQQLFALADSTAGVSLDEESINLVQFQRAFEASSRVISMVDDMYQQLLQLI